ncbi:hypothetical protein [Shinella sp.]|uniref:hypothetical protein n=1 Tax=Shinella sp. TaxID=1870904 RepID=UPI002899EB02|nr:hypothetical protein [Shinella sp.]
MSPFDTGIAEFGLEIEAYHVDPLLPPSASRCRARNLERGHEQYVLNDKIIGKQALNHEVAAFLPQGYVRRLQNISMIRAEIGRGEIELRPRTVFLERLLHPVPMKYGDIRWINPLGIVDSDNQRARIDLSRYAID